MLIFSFRLAVAASSIASTIAYARFSSSGSRLGIARTVVWQESQLALSLMTASIPCLKTFLEAFTSAGLLTVHGRNMIAYRPPTRPPVSDSKSRAQTTPRLPLVRPWLRSRESSSIQRRLRPDGHDYEANVHAHGATPDWPGARSTLQRSPESVESFNSDRLTIQRSVEIQVEHS